MPSDRSESIGKHSLRRFVRIPRQSRHPFHAKLDSDSIANWTPVPRQTGQFFVAFQRWDNRHGTLVISLEMLMANKRLPMRTIEEVLRLHFAGGRSNREISEVIRVSPTTVVITFVERGVRVLGGSP